VPGEHPPAQTPLASLQLPQHAWVGQDAVPSRMASWAQGHSSGHAGLGAPRPASQRRPRRQLASSPCALLPAPRRAGCRRQAWDSRHLRACWLPPSPGPSCPPSPGRGGARCAPWRACCPLLVQAAYYPRSGPQGRTPGGGRPRGACWCLLVPPADRWPAPKTLPA
jgi:hypothetical protein